MDKNIRTRVMNDKLFVSLDMTAKNLERTVLPTIAELNEILPVGLEIRLLTDNGGFVTDADWLTPGRGGRGLLCIFDLIDSETHRRLIATTEHSEIITVGMIETYESWMKISLEGELRNAAKKQQSNKSASKAETAKIFGLVALAGMAVLAATAAVVYNENRKV